MQCCENFSAAFSQAQHKKIHQICDNKMLLKIHQGIEVSKEFCCECKDAAAVSVWQKNNNAKKIIKIIMEKNKEQAKQQATWHDKSYCDFNQKVFVKYRSQFTRL